MRTHGHVTVTEDDFFSGCRAVFPSWSQKYARVGQGERAVDGDWKPGPSGYGCSGYLGGAW